MDGRPARVLDALITAKVARRRHDARALILAGRVWMDGVKVVRTSEGIPPGRHTITLVAYSGDVKISVSGHDDFRV